MEQRLRDLLQSNDADNLTLDDPFDKPAWNGWTPDPTKSHRYQSAADAGITAADIPKLKLKWAFAFPEAASAAWTQPTVVGGARRTDAPSPRPRSVVRE